MGFSRRLRGRELVAVETRPDLAERLEHVRSRALRRAVQTSADRVVVEIVDLAHDEGQSLLERQAPDRALQECSRLTEARLVFRPVALALAARHRDGLVGDTPAFLGPE